jgi:cytoskeletal protein RodZ
MSDSPRDVGVLLKQERERKGIAIEVVHEATKIPLDALKAIEEGYKVRTLTAFYYKSFVKIYAQYLGLDANFIVTLIPTHHPKPLLPVTPLRPGSAPAVASGAGAHRVEGVRSRSWNLLSHPIVLKKKKKVFKAVLMIALACVGMAVLVIGVRKIATTISVNRAMDTASKPESKVLVKKTTKVTKDEPVKGAASKTVAPVAEVKVEQKVFGQDNAPKALKRVSITVRAQTNTWINVHVDGVGVFQGNLKKGTASSWHGVKRIELSAKDVGALEFEVNGRKVGKLARRDLKAKKVVVTPEGLDVDK